MARPVDPELRARLLEAAANVFAERGFGGATMQEVGERAGVTKGGVYFHFRGKEELFFAVFDERRRRLRAVLSRGDGVARGPDGANELGQLLRDYLDVHFRDPTTSRLMRVLVTELRDRFTAELREDAAGEQRLVRSRVREALARGNHDGTLFAPDPALAAFVLAGAVRGVLEQWLTAPAEAEPFCSAEALAAELVARYASSRRGGVAEEHGEVAPPAPDDSGADFRPPF